MARPNPGLLIMTRERRAVISTPLSASSGRAAAQSAVPRSVALLDESPPKNLPVLVYSEFYSRGYTVVPVGGFLSITKVPRRIDV